MCWESGRFYARRVDVDVCALLGGGDDLVEAPYRVKTRPEDFYAEDEPRPGVDMGWKSRKVDLRLSGKGNSNSHGAGPVY